MSGKPTCYIYTEKSYKNYVLRYDWRFPEGSKPDSNSGCLVHIQPPHKVMPKSVEPQGRYRDHGKLFFLGGVIAYSNASKADRDEAAKRLAAILVEEEADVLTTYDDNGGYGHPDHIQVHRVGVRAAELAGTRKVYEATLDRDYLVGLWRQAAEMGLPSLPDGTPDDFEMGKPSHLITTRVDVLPFIERKRAAMAAHASQIAETSFFLSMPEQAFNAVWGIEAYILRGAAPGTEETDLFAGL